MFSIIVGFLRLEKLFGESDFFFRQTQPFFPGPRLYFYKLQKSMRNIRGLILTLSKMNLFNVMNSRASFYVLLVAFIILLLAAETLIKQTFVPL